MSFGITTEWRSASDRNRVHLRPDSPPLRTPSSDALVRNAMLLGRPRFQIHGRKTDFGQGGIEMSSALQ